ncbi:Uncharacterized protein Rs2_40091 [Raphanus sativus]|nr:Uncharacterized protein Rs2_40091 [Raphanus sativus]
MGDENSSFTSTNTTNPIPTPPLTDLSPYYLHPSDNPGALITSVLLTHENYTEWSTELQNSLQAKKKTGFIDGTIAKPKTEPDLTRWLAANSMIVGWIRTSIDSKVRSTVTHFMKLTSFGKLYASASPSRMAPACINYKMRSRILILRKKEKTKVHKFLFGLDDSRFSSIRSRITDEEPLPNINIVYSCVIREEHNMVVLAAGRQREIMHQLDILSNLVQEYVAERSRTDSDRTNSATQNLGPSTVPVLVALARPLAVSAFLHTISNSCCNS